MKYIKYILVFVGIFIIIRIVVSCIGFIANFSGNSYKYAESYVIINNNAITEEEFIDILYKFQCNYPEYQLIDINEKGEEYHYFKAIKNYEFSPELVFFYFKDIDKTVSCIIEVSIENNVLIKLYAVNDGVIFREWKRINYYKEISRKENRKIKKKFEKEILNKLGKWKRYK